MRGGSFSGARYDFPSRKREVLGTRAERCEKDEGKQCEGSPRADELQLADGTKYLLTNMADTIYDELVSLSNA